MFPLRLTEILRGSLWASSILAAIPHGFRKFRLCVAIESDTFVGKVKYDLFAEASDGCGHSRVT
jgi:hypothetical protein